MIMFTIIFILIIIALSMYDGSPWKEPEVDGEEEDENENEDEKEREREKGRQETEVGMNFDEKIFIL